MHHRARGRVFCNDLAGKNGFQFGLQIPLEGSCTINRVIGGVNDKVFGSVADLQGKLLLLHAALQLMQQQVHNAPHVFFGERLVKDNLVQPVQELRTDRLLQQFQYLDLRLVYHLVMRGGCHLLEVLTNQGRT